MRRNLIRFLAEGYGCLFGVNKWNLTLWTVIKVVEKLKEFDFKKKNDHFLSVCKDWILSKCLLVKSRKKIRKKLKVKKLSN